MSTTAINNTMRAINLRVESKSDDDGDDLLFLDAVVAAGVAFDDGVEGEDFSFLLLLLLFFVLLLMDSVVGQQIFGVKKVVGHAIFEQGDLQNAAVLCPVWS